MLRLSREDLAQMNQGYFQSLDKERLVEVAGNLHQLAIEQLEKLEQNSKNSSKPPSSDSPFRGEVETCSTQEQPTTEIETSEHQEEDTSGNSEAKEKSSVAKGFGTIDRCVREVGIACTPVVEELIQELQAAEIIHLDETPWYEKGIEMQMNSIITQRYTTDAYTRDCLELINLVNDLFENFPDVAYQVLDLPTILSRFAYTVELAQNANEFSEEGRGYDYTNSIQIGLLTRSEGTTDLLKFAHPDRKLTFSSEYVITDFLAGDGYIEQVATQLLPAYQKPFFINSDISFYMVQCSQRKNQFSVLQPAQDAYWLRSNSVNAVIYAYGTHHIPKNQRTQAVKEGARVLKPGGRFVLHDFEEGGFTSDWFQRVVNLYGKTRHDYPHFTQEEMLGLAQMAELRDVKVEYISDPFVTQASTEIGALSLLAEYAIQMYGLIGLRGELHKTLDLLDSYFHGIQIQQIPTGDYKARILRNALVVHGIR